MNRISSSKLLEGLISYGLFTDKIPPFLSAEQFFKFAKTFDHTQFPSSNFHNPNFIAGFIQYENMRNINIPRELAIPNPIAYFNLCKCLSDNWNRLKKHFEANTKLDEFKISRIHIRKMKGKKIIFKMGDYDTKISKKGYYFDKKELFNMSFKDYKEDDDPIPKILIRNKFTVNADISNCFGSIYSHALSWALVSKKTAKTQKKGYWHNDIDRYTMNLNNGETHGILIGCHASNLLSEIILVVIDKELTALDYQYIRNIDDYTCYVENFEKAEQFLIDLSNELKKFGLSLNHKKTKIEPLPLSVSTHWIRKLGYFSNKNFFNYTDIQQFLDTTIELMANNHDNAAIMNYTMKVISKKKLSKSALTYYIDIIHHLVLIYPYLVHLIEKYLFQAFAIPSNKIAEITYDLYKIGTNKKINEVVSYALYFSIKYKFNLIKLKVYEYAKNSNDCIVILLSFLYDKRNCRRMTDTLMKEYKNLANTLCPKGQRIDEFWLFIYEISTHSRFPKDSDWYQMKQQKISFIKTGFSEFLP